MKKSTEIAEKTWKMNGSRITGWMYWLHLLTMKDMQIILPGRLFNFPFSGMKKFESNKKNVDEPVHISTKNYTRHFIK